MEEGGGGSEGPATSSSASCAADLVILRVAVAEVLGFLLAEGLIAEAGRLMVAAASTVVPSTSQSGENFSAETIRLLMMLGWGGRVSELSSRVCACVCVCVCVCVYVYVCAVKQNEENTHLLPSWNSISRRPWGYLYGVI